MALPLIPFMAIHQVRRRADPALRWLLHQIAACMATRMTG